MLHRFYAHNSSGSQSRLFTALLLTVTVFFGLSYSGVAKAGTSNQTPNLYAGHEPTRPNTRAHALTSGQMIFGQKQNAQKAGFKPHPNTSGLSAAFEDFSFSPIGTNAPFAAGVAVDPFGNIFYSDFTDGNIYEATPTATGYTLTIIIQGHPGAFGLAVDPYDDLFIADAKGGAVYMDSPNGSGGWAEVVVDSHLNYPESVALYGNNVFVADEQNGQVYEEVYNGNLTWTRTTVFSGSFYEPTAVATDANGDLFVGDYQGSGKAYSYLYVLYNSYGSLASPSYITDGFDFISGLAVADNGTLYVVDFNNTYGLPYVEQLYSNSNWGYEKGTELTYDYNGNLSAPYGAAVDSLGNFYTADNGNNGLVEDGGNAGGVQVGYENAPQNFIFANFQVTGTGTDAGGFVSTNGESGYDFFNYADTCAGATFTATTGYCQVMVGFAPLTAGQRSGGVTIQDSAYNIIGQSPSFFGSGIAPLASFLPGTMFATPYGGGFVGGSKMQAQRYNNKDLKHPQQLKGNPETLSRGNWISSYGGNSAAGIFIDPYGAIFVADPYDCVILTSFNQGQTWVSLPNYNTETGQKICPSGGLAVDGDGNVFYTAYGSGSFPAGVWVDYADLGLSADTYLVANYTPYADAVFDKVDAVAVDQFDNVYFTAYYGYGNGEHVFTEPAQAYFGDLSYADVSNVKNYKYVNQIPQKFGYLTGISVYSNASNNPVIATTDYDSGEVWLLFAQSTGTYSASQIARGLDTPSAVQWTPYGDLYVMDSGDDTGISVLYLMQPGYGLGGPSQAFQLTPLSISNYVNGQPYYWTFTTDSLQNFYITDFAVNGSLSGRGLITQIDTSDAPTLYFQNTMVGVASPDSPQTELIFDSGNDVLQLLAPTSGTNPSISMNYLLNTSYVSYYPGTTIPVGDCPLIASGGSIGYVSTTQACALPVSFMPTVAGTDTGTLVVTDDTLYGYSVKTFAKGAARPSKTRTANLKPSIVPLGAMGRPTSKFHAEGITPVTQTINLNGYASEATPTVTLLTADNPAMLGNLVPFAVSVDGAGVTPMGVVYVFDMTNPALPVALGSGTLSGGTTTVNVLFTASGVFHIQAYFCGTGVFANNVCPSTGDGNYMTAYSNVIAQSVVDFTMNFTITGSGSSGGPGGGNLPIVKNGQSLSVNFTVAPVGGTTFPYAITLSGSGGPLNTSYAFTPATIPANSGSTAVTLIINIPIDFVASNDAPKTPGNSKLPIAPLALAALLLPLAGRLRKAGKRFAKMAAVVLLVLAGITATVTLSGCGANTAAVYQIDVTGTSGSLVHTSTFDITVE